MSEQDRPWTIEEAAQFLSLSEEVVRRKARAGELRGTKLGRSWRFRPEDVRALLEGPNEQELLAADIAAHVQAEQAKTQLRLLRKTV